MYSIDYKKRAVAYKEEGHTFKELAEAFCIGNQTYYLWKRNLESGYYASKGKQERKRKIDKEKLKEKLAERPDIYVHELADIFDCSGQAISLALKKMGITRKKRVLPTEKNAKRRERNI
jgi:transposase